MIPYLLIRDNWTTDEDLEVIVMSLKVIEALSGWVSSAPEEYWQSAKKEQPGSEEENG